MTTKDILEAAREMIAKPHGWTKNKLERAGAVCAVGAISKVATGRATALGPMGTWIYESDENLVRAKRLLDRAVAGSIVDYNDSHTKKCVVAAFDAAIERAE
jgi:hypothetical protein